jgi:hypothetical protein
MGIEELARQYAALPPPERAVFAAMVRAHELFNTPTWREEIARRNRAIEGGSGVRVFNATEVEAVRAAGRSNEQKRIQNLSREGREGDEGTRTG